MPQHAHDITIDEIEYLRHGDKALKARLFRPRGDGPFPAVIDLHGGAWTSGDLKDCAPRDEVLAHSGLFVAALNFRHAGEGYPTSLADINYGIRWLKSQAREYRIHGDRIGLSGQSSGGHLAMLAAMRPTDPRYAAIPLPAGAAAVDATVRCVVMTWPVINPLSRYRHAQRLRQQAEPPGWTRDMKERHDLYWRSEANMAEGNPMLALERGERVMTPPALWVQGRPDPVHDYHDPDGGFAGAEPERFASNYRKAGGEIELLHVANEARATDAVWERIAAFFHRQMAA